MRTAINKKRIVPYAVCAFFFCLAGVFQAVKCLKASPLISKAKKSPHLSDAGSHLWRAEKLLPRV